MSRKVLTTKSPSSREALRNNHFLQILRGHILQIAKSCQRCAETAGFQQQSLFSPLMRCAPRRRAQIKTRSDAPFNAAKGTLVNNAPIKASKESTFQPVNEMLVEDRATPWKIYRIFLVRAPCCNYARTERGLLVNVDLSPRWNCHSGLKIRFHSDLPRQNSKADPLITKIKRDWALSYEGTTTDHVSPRLWGS